MDYSEIVKEIKQSIAFIVALNKDNKPFSTGSGFIYSKKGILITCNHVVKDATSIVIKFPDNDIFINAKIVLRDDEHDLAVLKFDDLTRLPLIQESDLQLIREGMPVIFSGYPLSIQSLTTHQGILSAITKDATGTMTYLVDGTVNSGNSGCPLMTKDGKVIGVVNAKRREDSLLLSQVEKMSLGAVSLHGVDLVSIYQALINNVQLGIGYAVPAAYIPEHKEIDDTKKE
jgi:S1-C subfamily serine protease